MHTDDLHLSQHTVPEERDLLERLSRGEAEAFNTLYLRYLPDLLRYLGPFSKWAEPMEIVQDIFCRIWLKRDGIVAVQSFRLYLFRMAHNRLLDIRRGQDTVRRHAPLYAADQPGTVPAPDHDLEYQALHRAALAALDGMPPRRRAVWDLLMTEGLSREAIAARLQVSLSLVDKQFWRANKTIRDAIAAAAREK